MPKAQLEELKASIRTRTVEYLQSQGIDPHNHFPCPNPIHRDSTPSAHLLPGKDGVYCFGKCGRHFDIFELANFFENKPLTGKGFIKNNILYLAEKFGIPAQLEPLTDEELYELNTYRAYRVASDLITSSKQSKIVKDEIKKRGWSEALLKANRVGTVKSFEWFREEMRGAGFTANFLDEVDLGKRGTGGQPSPIFQPDSLIFTITDEKGRPVGFAARNLKHKKGDPRKYVNQMTTGLKCNIYKKGQRLHGFDIAQTYSKIYLFEGYTDVLTARQHGLLECVSCGGTALTKDHVLLIKSSGILDLCICFDGDEAGQKNMLELLDTRLSGHRDLNVKIKILPEDMDPDEYIRAKGIEAFRNIPELSAFQWRLTQFDEDEDAEKICRTMIPLIANESSPIAAESMCRDLALRTGWDLQPIRAELYMLMNQKDKQKERERQNIVEKTILELERSPSDSEAIITSSLHDLAQISIKHDEAALSEIGTLTLLKDQKEQEELKEGQQVGFVLGPKFHDFQPAIAGEMKGTTMIVGGRGNAGKCLSENTPILLADGTFKKISEIVEKKISNIVEMSPGHRIKKTKAIDWIKSGTLDCVRLKTKDGLELECTPSHPFYTEHGWKPLKDLVPGDRIAAAAKYSCFDSNKSPISKETAIFLAGFLAEGSITESVGFCNRENEIINLFEQSILKEFPGVQFRIDKNQVIHVTDKEKGRSNRVKDYLEELNLMGKNSHTKFVPDCIFQCSPKRIATFLGMLYACDGWVTKRKNSREIGLCFCNRKMLQQVRHLLLRFGIKTTIRKGTSSYSGSNKKFERYTIAIQDINNIRIFYNNIRIPLKRKQEKVKTIIKEERRCLVRGGYNDNFPSSLWKRIQNKLDTMRISKSELFRLVDPLGREIFGYDKQKDRFKTTSILDNGGKSKTNITRSLLRTIGYILQDDFLISLAEGDIYFDKITEIKPIGKRKCYDLEVPSNNNFIANNIIVHNSSICAALAHSIAMHHEQNDTIVIYHTIDDSPEQILPKFICLQDGTHKLELNHVMFPKFWAKHVDYPLLTQRSKAYSKLNKLIKSGHLMIKGAHPGSVCGGGNTLTYTRTLLHYLSNRYPNKHILYVLDNFHDLQDFQNMRGGNDASRIERMGKSIKGVATEFQATIISTMEYTKMEPGIEPNMNNLRGSAALQYVGNIVCHVYNDVHDKGSHAAEIYHMVEKNGELIKYPRLKVITEKNKVASFKGNTFLNFWPACSDFGRVPPDEIKVAEELGQKESPETILKKALDND